MSLALITYYIASFRVIDDTLRNLCLDTVEMYFRWTITGIRSYSSELSHICGTPDNYDTNNVDDAKIFATVHIIETLFKVDCRLEYDMTAQTRDEIIDILIQIVDYYNLGKNYIVLSHILYNLVNGDLDAHNLYIVYPDWNERRRLDIDHILQKLSQHFGLPDNFFQYNVSTDGTPIYNNINSTVYLNMISTSSTSA